MPTFSEDPRQCQRMWGDWHEASRKFAGSLSGKFRRGGLLRNVPVCTGSHRPCVLSSGCIRFSPGPHLVFCCFGSSHVACVEGTLKAFPRPPRRHLEFGEILQKPVLRQSHQRRICQHRSQRPCISPRFGRKLCQLQGRLLSQAPIANLWHMSEMRATSKQSNLQTKQPHFAISCGWL